MAKKNKIVITDNKEMIAEFMNLINKPIYEKKSPMFFKDEGGYYVTKLTASNEPADPNKMYEFGTLTEVPVPNKRTAIQYAKQFGRTAIFG